jgi:hypothetical protein
VSKLLEAAATVAIIVLLGWALRRTFGVQVFGVPAFIGLLVILAGRSIFSNSGWTGLLVTVVGLLALAIVIGMAMTLGADRPDRPEDERPLDDS